MKYFTEFDITSSSKIVLYCQLSFGHIREERRNYNMEVFLVRCMCTEIAIHSYHVLLTCFSRQRGFKLYFKISDD